MVIDVEHILWDLFKKTGNVNYYLLYQKIRGKDERNSGRDYTSRN